MMQLVYLLIAILGIPSLYLLIYGAPYAPTHQEAVDAAVAYMNEHDISYAADIGAGDGRVVIALAEAGIEAHGYELNPVLVAVARFRIWRRGLSSHAHMHLRDIWRVDLSRFEGVFVFGISHIMDDLQSKLEPELSEDAVVVSHLFEIPGWKYTKHTSNTYCYRVSDAKNEVDS